MENLTPQLLAHVMIAVSGYVRAATSLSLSLTHTFYPTSFMTSFIFPLILVTFTQDSGLWLSGRLATLLPVIWIQLSLFLSLVLCDLHVLRLAEMCFWPCTVCDLFPLCWWPTLVMTVCLTECEYVIQHCCGEAKGSDTYNAPTYFSIIAEAFLQYHSLSDNELYSDE